jgi:hypothetical protein
MKTSAQIFADLGNPWDHDARRNPCPTGPIVRYIESPLGRDVELDWENEGFAPDGKPDQARARPHVPCPRGVKSERPSLWVQMRSENGPTYRPPEYRRVVREGETCGRHPEAKDVVLTEEMLLIRKRQQAAVKARLTRAQNKMKAAEAERLALVSALRVKLSQRI